MTPGPRRRTALLAISCIGPALTLSACGNLVTADVRGESALSLNGTGEVLLHVDTCDYRLNGIGVYEGREKLPGGEENVRMGELSTDSPQHGMITVNLQSPETPWEATDPVTMRESDDLIFIVIPTPDGTVAGRDEAIPQVAATLTQLKALEPGEVLVNDYSHERATEPYNSDIIDEIGIPEEDFHANCPRTGTAN